MLRPSLRSTLSVSSVSETLKAEAHAVIFLPLDFLLLRQVLSQKLKGSKSTQSRTSLSFPVLAILVSKACLGKIDWKLFDLSD
jgi:hypothetical protein